jgi:hypothetical protein
VIEMQRPMRVDMRIGGYGNIRLKSVTYFIVGMYPLPDLGDAGLFKLS